MAKYVYAKALAWDERLGRPRRVKRMEAEHIGLRRPLRAWAFPYQSCHRGLSR